MIPEPLYDPRSYVPLTADVFHFLVAALGEQALKDIDWSEAAAPPADAEAFARETIFVICNSGMKSTVATMIFWRCMAALAAGQDVHQAFGHAGKAAAIARVWRERGRLFADYLAACSAKDQLAFLASLPWIGPVTSLHLAKNFGLNVAKPDVHLQRLAERDGSTVQALCQRLAAETGYRAATIDTILWRACAEGVIDSKTGLIPAIEHLNAIRSLQAGQGSARCAAVGSQALTAENSRSPCDTTTTGR